MSFAYRKQLVAALVLLISLGVGSCMNYVEPKEQILEYLQEKYGETFTYLCPYGGSPGSKSSEILVTSEKFPGEEILARQTNVDGDMMYQDNYTAYLFHDSVEKRIQDIASKVYRECKVLYEIEKHMLPEAFNPEMPLEEFTSSVDSSIYVHILVGPKSSLQRKEQDLEAFRVLLKENKVLINGVLSYSTDSQVVQEATGETIYQYYEQDKQWSSAGASFSMNREYAFRYVDWR